MNTNIYERIKSIRKKMNFSSRELFADALSIPFGTLRSYEQAKIKVIPDTFLHALTSKFNVNINWLITGEGEMFIKNNSPKSYNQIISENSGQITGISKGDTIFNKNEATPKLNETQIDKATYSLFLESYNKAKRDDKLKDFRIYLMNF